EPNFVHARESHRGCAHLFDHDQRASRGDVQREQRKAGGAAATYRRRRQCRGDSGARGGERGVREDHAKRRREITAPDKGKNRAQKRRPAFASGPKGESPTANARMAAKPFLDGSLREGQGAVKGNPRAQVVGKRRVLVLLLP